MPKTNGFTGFPPTGVQFLRNLRENNDKAWFEAHKAAYLADVQGPALALVEALGGRLNEQYPAITYDTRANGSGSLMRLYRDTRFSADKSPYKTNVAMVFTFGTGKKMESPGFGLQITPEKVEMYAGIFAFPKPMLDAYRQAVLTDKHAKTLEAAAAAVQRAGAYPLGGETYKRVPTGFDADHPRAQWLRYTGLHAGAPDISLEVAATPTLVEAVMAHFTAMSPIPLWLFGALER
jgi:uncharacterized protein (TIGR02453 family)